ncbi:hypothetical protein V3C99_018352 [Haemonchus contortus]|uniref:Reverse transcriptase domain-containing protein n=1 Tax=Haemonchus contortus TaxID=6289 RepID=A0A7I4Z1I7_HAECO
MGRIEEPVLERHPLMYCRYIDDCFIVTSTQFEMDECFRIMNEQSQYIKLTREVPHDGWLPYLNTQVEVSNGAVSVKWYRKTSSENILLHATSAHPQAVKRAVVNMLRTATSVCTGEAERHESRRLACEIAAVNGSMTSAEIEEEKNLRARARELNEASPEDKKLFVVFRQQVRKKIKIPGLTNIGPGTPKN